nr:rhodanese-like domain-containing protein [uncultured Shimia sp.]
MQFWKHLRSHKLGPEDAVNALREGTAILIDVREQAEVSSTGHATGAIHIPLFRLQDMATPGHPDCHPSLDQAATIFLYCASGGRSYSAARLLRKLGYEDVHNIGGIGHWIRAGGQIEAP